MHNRIATRAKTIGHFAKHSGDRLMFVEFEFEGSLVVAGFIE